MARKRIDETVEKIVRMFDELDLSFLEIESGKSFKVKLYREGVPTMHSGVAPAPVPQPAPVVPSSGVSLPSQESVAEAFVEETTEESHGYHEIRSPMAGTFYRAPAPGADPFVKEGDSVKPGDTLCIVEAMKVMNEIKSDVSGKVVKILKENAEPVRAGDVLFWIDTSA